VARAGARNASNDGVAAARIDRATRRHVRGRTIRGASDEGSRSMGATSTRRLYFASRNHLLLALSTQNFNLLKPHLERVNLPVGTRLIEPNTPIEYVYFLEEGIASVVATTPQGRRIEAGIIGREGLSGIPVLLGTDRTPQECFIQTAGEGLRIGADDVRCAMAASASLQQHLLRFVQAFMIQMGQTAQANGSHTVSG